MKSYEWRVGPPLCDTLSVCGSRGANVLFGRNRMSKPGLETLKVDVRVHGCVNLLE